MHRRKSVAVHSIPLYAWTALSLVTVFFLLMLAVPVMAHHPMGGRLPGNGFEGFLSGFAHPLIGPDHFAFMVAVGLLSAVKQQGVSILVAFIVSSMVGTGLHVLGLDIPFTELFISGSVLLFGVLLARQNKYKPNTFLIMLLAAISGVFHGYAYGEAVVGAETAPLLSYLVGFTTIQVVMSAGIFALISRLSQGNGSQKLLINLGSAGLVLCGIGAAFLSSQLVSILLPT